MVTDRALDEFEEAQEDERTRARQRIEMAERYIDEYRSRIRTVQEHFHEFAAREGIGDDPGFRDELQRASHNVDENVARAGHRIAELEDEYDQLLRHQSDARDRYLTQRNHED